MKTLNKVLSVLLSVTLSLCILSITPLAIDDSDFTPPIDIRSAKPSLLASSVEVVPVRHDLSIDEIVARARTLPHSGFDPEPTQYDIMPSLRSPYSAGSLKQTDINDALNAVKMVRFLAGLPYENIKFTDELNNISQHGAVLLAASNQTGHNPSQPSDMSDDFYELGYLGCSQANVHYVNNITYAVLDFIYDPGQSNLGHAGHRRWVLKPGAENFGIGYAKNGTEHRVNMHVFDGLGPWECEPDSYIAWPAAGNFPIQYFAGSYIINQTMQAPWSINLGALYEAPSKEDITLKLTRESDGKVWIFDKNTPDLSVIGISTDKLHLSVDNDGYGMKKAIIFRPDLISLGKISDGENFTVELSGIKYTDGSDAVLKYDINFFDLEKELNNYIADFTVISDGSALCDAMLTINGTTYRTDAEGKVSVKLRSGEFYDYTVSKPGYNTFESTLTLSGSNLTKSIELTPYTVTETEDSITISMKLVSSERTGIIVAALYDGKTLLASKKASAKSSVTVTLPNKNGTSIKIFHLNQLNKLVPLREAAIIKLNKKPDSIVTGDGSIDDYTVEMWDDTATAYKDYETTYSSDYSYCIESDTPNDIRLKKSFPTEEGKVYKVSAYFKTENLTSSENATLGANISVGNWNNSATLFGDNDWTKLSMFFSGDEQSETEISFNFGYWSNTCTGKLYIDNIQIEEIIPTDKTEWKFLFAIFKNNSFSYANAASSNSMTGEEITIIEDAISHFQADLYTISNGMIIPRVEIVQIDEPITNLSDYGSEELWLSPENAYDLLKNHVDINNYDHVTAFANFDSVTTSYFGAGGTTFANKTGYSFINTQNRDYCLTIFNPDLYWAPSAIVHEFLHFMETWANILNHPLPLELHDAEEYGYIDDDDWRAWYKDFINSAVKDSSGNYIGIPRDVWGITPSDIR